MVDKGRIFDIENLNGVRDMIEHPKGENNAR